jgi:hypothetical protein
MGTHGSATAILAAVDRLNDHGLIAIEPLEDALSYWQARYWSDEGTTAAFEDLKFRANDHRPLVEAVLSGAEGHDPAKLKALLIIVLRLRNNLFHGHKWSHCFHGQQENFSHACSVLMMTIDMHRSLETD